MAWQPADSIDRVRTELRDALFWTTFRMISMRLEENTDKVFAMRQKAIGFAEFGVKSGLIDPTEGNHWLDVIWERKSLGEATELLGITSPAKGAK